MKTKELPTPKERKPFNSERFNELAYKIDESENPKLPEKFKFIEFGTSIDQSYLLEKINDINDTCIENGGHGRHAT